ncbi:MAG: LysM peptidoglycan-binding domain-containing protein [Planctomycetes bacterium]|nr:LysM peptidoglycan-binding domain-containing protein [Planctomycetota bacterium]
MQPGDTFASLALAYYGSSKYARFLVEQNPGLGDPGKLTVGTLVKIPPQPASYEPASAKRTESGSGAATAKAPAGQRTYQVRSGDSFYAIARDQLGDATRWKELLDLNKELVKGDPTRLRTGQVVLLPAS